ncbi:MAG: hypothetical protein HGA72_03370 [Chlorobiaceae bacterium]|nr:hypothetical protein [Chlorobiaceae bacterium]NTW64148.1 hypothetical protein [Chlorobiaceae bacterium]
MKKKGSVAGMVLCLSIVVSGPVFGEKAPSAVHGKALFNSTSLGGAANTRTCNACHPDGRGLERAGGNPELSRVINTCITGPLKGSKLEPGSIEMQSLLLYIKSLKQ